MADTGNVKQRKNAKAAGPANTSRRASPVLQKQEPSDFDDSLMTKLLFASLALVFGAAVWLVSSILLAILMSSRLMASESRICHGTGKFILRKGH